MNIPTNQANPYVPPVNTNPSPLAPAGGISPPVLNPQAVPKGSNETLAQRALNVQAQTASSLPLNESEQIMRDEVEQGMLQELQDIVSGTPLEQAETPPPVDAHAMAMEQSKELGFATPESDGSITISNPPQIALESENIHVGVPETAEPPVQATKNIASRAVLGALGGATAATALASTTASDTVTEVRAGAKQASDTLLGFFDIFNRSVATNLILFFMYVAITHVVFFTVIGQTQFRLILTNGNAYAYSWLWPIIIMIIVGLVYAAYALIKKPIDYAMDDSNMSDRKREKLRGKAEKRAIKAQNKAEKKRRREELKLKKKEVSDLEKQINGGNFFTRLFKRG